MKTILSITLFSLFVSFTTTSCSQQEETETALASTEITESKVSPNAAIEMSVTGMTCEHGCGGALTKAIKAVEGVASSSLDFEAERAQNVFTVEYDSKLTSPALIKVAIESIIDGQYTVEEMNEIELTRI